MIAVQMRIKGYIYPIGNTDEELCLRVAKKPLGNILKTPTQHFVEIYFSQAQTLNKWKDLIAKFHGVS